uniref:Uncharacterized protein n=1 Tax=Tetraselmis sp. GSL018 TaxID=582737 RepID=A0A061RN28_9CHLO
MIFHSSSRNKGCLYNVSGLRTISPHLNLRLWQTLLNAVKQNYALIFSKAFRIFLIADGKTRYVYQVFKIEYVFF